MKRLSFVLVVLIVLGCLVSAKSGLAVGFGRDSYGSEYYYESEIDPCDLEDPNKWEIVDAKIDFYRKRIIFTYRNLDTKAPIQVVVCYFTRRLGLLSYAYLKDGGLDYFVFAPPNRYIRFMIDQESARKIIKYLLRFVRVRQA